MFKKVNNDAILPQAQTSLSAGYDVYASEDTTIKAGQTKLVPLGIALDLGANALKAQKGFYIGLYLRSSYGAKGLILPNGVGIIDIDYKDEIKQIIHNPLTDSAGYENKDFHIKKGDRVGQFIVHKHFGFEFMGDKYRKDATRVGGFGSSGVK